MTKNESNLNTIINVWESYTIKNIGIHSNIINVGIRSTIKNVRTNALQSRLDYHDTDTHSTVNKMKSNICSENFIGFHFKLGLTTKSASCALNV